jgi:hypothetical protein
MSNAHALLNGFSLGFAESESMAAVVDRRAVGISEGSSQSHEGD